ncbi:MAG: APC family permease [Deltaproteobacteria bacterium]|nr:MAG: APC family permease [Deltaproteobacteria bacterium]
MSDATGGSDGSGGGTSSGWDFPGWGVSRKLTDIRPKPVNPHPHDRLGQLASTAICGNDITSSCLYVSALCAAQAGRYAPIVLAIVAAVLFLFRKVYAEVGSALPLNGGTYTVLLNTTNKRVAAAAACLTLLSYVATAVISAGEAMHYAHNLIEALPVFWATIGLLGLFAVLTIIGLTESAVVAIGIFVFHLTTLTVLAASSSFTVLRDPSLLSMNWATPAPGGFGRALFFGFAAAMLGISGFESSANFIEEQKPGVFPKTLRNMWVAVAIFNPLLSLLSLGLLPLAEIQEVPPDLLARMGERSLGDVLRFWVSLDAVLVLSGAVLTSFVGVVGLMRRMSLDRCLPQFLLKENRWRGTNHWIVLVFFGVCVSILAVTAGDVERLAGVYTLSFLSVMALFAVGNMMLKVKRGRLPRAVKASWPTVLVAFLAVLVGLAGNVAMSPANVEVFTVYFAITAGVVALMFLRVQIMRVVLYTSEAMLERVKEINDAISRTVTEYIRRINERPCVYFTRGDNPAMLNRAALYVLENEQTNRLTVVHVYEKEEDIPPRLAEHLQEIDHLYPELRIDFLAVKGKFTPGLVAALSEELGVPTNYMFIGTPGDRFTHRIEELGGVRLIL